MKHKHFTIPVFIPMEACPFRCIYCDQRLISGTQVMPPVARVGEIIHEHLATIPAGAFVEIGFFGGTFTGLSMETQREYLEAVQEFIHQGRIRAIRLSTRPDQINEVKLDMLRKYHVETIELGAQSMDDEVLRKSGRGHAAQHTADASALIRGHGFRLGLQMMIGLPGDSLEKCVHTAREFIRLGAVDVRIYPALVIRGTGLEKLYRSGKYSPLQMEEAVAWSAEIIGIFEDAGVNVIRTGLHPSEGLLHGQDLVAGPFHVSFRELVMTELWNRSLKRIERPPVASAITVSVAPKQLNFAVGYHAANRRFLEKKFDHVKIITDHSLKNREFHVIYH